MSARFSARWPGDGDDNKLEHSSLCLKNNIRDTRAWYLLAYELALGCVALHQSTRHVITNQQMNNATELECWQWSVALKAQSTTVT